MLYAPLRLYSYLVYLQHVHQPLFSPHLEKTPFGCAKGRLPCFSEGTSFLKVKSFLYNIPGILDPARSLIASFEAFNTCKASIVIPEAVANVSSSGVSGRHCWIRAWILSGLRFLLGFDGL